MLSRILLLAAIYFIPADVDRLIVDTGPAEATVAHLDGKRTLLRLPDLDFPVRVVPRCGSGREPGSISISVADTHVRFGREALSGNATLETSISVPSRQIAPIAVDGFCSSGTGQSILLPTALTAHFSLRCVRDEDQSIAFRTQGLNVLVHCADQVRPD